MPRRRRSPYRCEATTYVNFDLTRSSMAELYLICDIPGFGFSIRASNRSAVSYAIMPAKREGEVKELGGQGTGLHRSKSLHGMMTWSPSRGFCLLYTSNGFSLRSISLQNSPRTVLANN